MACVPCRRARQKCVPLGPSCFRCLERNLLCERQNQFTPQECCNTLFDSKATFNKHRKQYHSTTPPINNPVNPTIIPAPVPPVTHPVYNHLDSLSVINGLPSFTDFTIKTSAIVDAICAASQHSLETLLEYDPQPIQPRVSSLESFTATPLSLDFSNPKERKRFAQQLIDTNVTGLTTGNLMANFILPPTADVHQRNEVLNASTRDWFAIASFEAVMDICRASVNLSVDIQQSILDTWMANGSDLSRNLGQYQ
ncbi:hypothetical protein HDU99_001849, partial [Rhizoclosmatium hyalinum]